MDNIYDFKVITITPALSNRPVQIESARLAQRLASLYKNNFKLALINVGALATGKTLKSVVVGFTLDSPSRGLYRRNVSARRTWVFIQKGRKKGGKLPVRKVGDKYEPVPELKEWFLALNIPRNAWLPIMKKIVRDGVKPRDIVGRMMRTSKPRKGLLLKETARNIASELVKTAKYRVHT